MFRLLLWKEWKENLWKLWFCGLASIAFVAMLFRIRIIPDMANCFWISLIQMFVVPIIYSMDIFSGEMSNRTIHLLFKIPVHRWMLFFSKYLVSIAGIILTFVISGVLMEFMAQGRESEIYFLLKMSFSFCIASIILFTWFSAFGCQTTSEAGSLVAMFSVIIGWGIFLFWAGICSVQWAMPLVPYFIPYAFVADAPTVHIGSWSIKYNLLRAVLSQSMPAVLVLVIACFRYVKIRRYL